MIWRVPSPSTPQPTRPISPLDAHGAWLGKRPSTSLSDQTGAPRDGNTVPHSPRHCQGEDATEGSSELAAMIRSLADEEQDELLKRRMLKWVDGMTS